MVGFFERLRRVTGDIPWGTVASVMAQNIGTSSDAAQEIAEQLTEWGSHLTKNALSKWTLAIMSPMPCESPDVSTGRPRPCSEYAVLRCDACSRACCLGHARVGYDGEGICEVCIGTAKRVARMQVPEKPGGMTAEQALRVLKLTRASSWEQIRRQYKRLCVKYNADRPQSEKTRTANVERLKKINAAYEVLRGVHEKQEAA